MKMSYYIQNKFVKYTRKNVIFSLLNFHKLDHFDQTKIIGYDFAIWENNFPLYNNPSIIS